jgi:hypothetical protein
MSATLEPTVTVEHRIAARSTRAVKLLLGLGIVYGITYVVFNDAIAAWISTGYSRIDQTVSELSAVGAPSRPFLVVAGIIWPLLMVAFGVGVCRAASVGAADHPAMLRATGGIFVAHGIFSSLWLLFPMSQRQDIVAGTTASNDLGHLVMAAGTVLFIVAELGVGAAAFGWWFRVYSITSAITILTFGMLTSAQVSNIADGQPTPFVGVYERINIGCWLLWMAVLSVVLIRRVDRVTDTVAPPPDASAPATA